MAHDHGVAVTTLNPCKFDNAIAHREGWSARWSGVINALMSAQGLKNRVQAHAETAGFAGIGHGRRQVGAAQAPAVKTVIAAFLAIFLEPDSFVGFATVDELGTEHTAGAQRLAVSFQHLVHHCIARTFSQAAVEIDLRREDIGHLAAHRIGQTGFIGRGVQRTRDHAASHAHAGRQGGGLQPHREPAVSLTAHDQTLEDGVVFIAQPANRQLAQFTLVSDFGGHGAATSCQCITHSRLTADGLKSPSVHDAQAPEQAFGRVARTGHFLAAQLKIDPFKGLGLQSQGFDLHGLLDQTNRELGRIRSQVGHRKGTSGPHQKGGSGQGQQLPGVALNQGSCAVHPAGQPGMFAVNPVEQAFRKMQTMAESAMERPTGMCWQGLKFLQE